MNRLVIVCGPTASGKTVVAKALAKKFNGELVSADSRQVYRGMDIGTGKDIASLQGISMWMYDVVDPDKPFSVSLYRKSAMRYIKDIRKRGKLPIIVGGTGLYIQSLVQTIPTEGVKPNIDLRKKLEVQPLDRLQAIMKEECLRTWGLLNDSDRNNPRRLIRKIELGRAGITDVKKPSTHVQDICWIGLTAPFPFIYDQIDSRVEKRVKEGVVAEIESLLAKGYTWGMPSMSGLGYAEWKGYFERKETLKEVVQKWKFDEHAYARRQMTWFKRNNAIRWFDVSQNDLIESIEQHIRTWYNTTTYGI
jgi:tRNA dimethylallyltransferase